MIFVLSVSILLLAGLWLWHLAGRSPARRYGCYAVWRTATVIGAVRIGTLWLGVFEFRYSDWRQILGYFLQMLALPEVYLARSMRADQVSWPMAVTLLLAATSLLWASLVVWILERLRR